jgi:hypothetical protein
MKPSNLNATSLLLILGLTGAAWAQDGAAAATEPPMPVADDDAVVDEAEAPDYPDPELLIRLESGGKVIEAKPSQTVKVGPEGKQVDVAVSVVRRFDVAGLRFDYPGEFVHELEIKDHHVWTLAGVRSIVLAFRYPGAINRDEMFKGFHESVAKEYDVDPKNSTKTTLEHPGGTLEGLLIKAVFKEDGAEQHIAQELYSFQAGGSVWILALQDAPDPATKQTSAEYAQMRALLAKTLTIQP